MFYIGCTNNSENGQVKTQIICANDLMEACAQFLGTEQDRLQDYLDESYAGWYDFGKDEDGHIIDLTIEGDIHMSVTVPEMPNQRYYICEGIKYFTERSITPDELVDALDQVCWIEDPDED